MRRDPRFAALRWARRDAIVEIASGEGAGNLGSFWSTQRGRPVEQTKVRAARLEALEKAL